MILPVWLWMVLAAATPCEASAMCSCRIPSPEAKYGEAEAVFRGVVVEVDDLASLPPGVWRRPVTLRVTRRWKGSEADTVVVGDHPGCAVGFEAGKEYVVYADRGAGGRLETSFCDRSRLLVHAVEDVPVLDRLASDGQR
jgi:hypothetical protein